MLRPAIYHLRLTPYVRKVESQLYKVIYDYQETITNLKKWNIDPCATQVNIKELIDKTEEDLERSKKAFYQITKNNDNYKTIITGWLDKFDKKIDEDGAFVLEVDKLYFPYEATHIEDHPQLYFSSDKKKELEPDQDQQLACFMTGVKWRVFNNLSWLKE